MSLEMSFVGVKDDRLQNLPGPQLKIGEIYPGKISAIRPFGLFIRLGDDKIGYREGLLHITQFSQERTEQDPCKFEKISSIFVRVLGIDLHEHI